MRRNWQYNEINVGVQPKGKQYEFVFKSTPECKPIKSAIPKCKDCTGVVVKRVGDIYEVKANFKTPTEMGVHLINMGLTQQNIKKVIDITYEDNTTEELSFIISILK